MWPDLPGVYSESDLSFSALCGRGQAEKKAESYKEKEPQEKTEEAKMRDDTVVPDAEVVHVADADYTPNPDRAIWIDGELNEALLDRVRPEILELTSQSGDPLTIFINSRGGRDKVLQQILDLLRPCRIITVALSEARSAAAELLSCGDFAVANPGSKLLYHGTRVELPQQEIKTGFASVLSESLKTSNQRIAAARFDKSAQRLIFLVVALRAKFEEHRANANGRTLADVDCFYEMLCQRVSMNAQMVLSKAATFWNAHHNLVTLFEEEVAKAKLSSETVDIEKIMFDASIAFEYESKKADREWSLRTGGLSRINNYFYFLASQDPNGDRFATFNERWASLVAADDDQDDLPAEKQAEKFRATFLPFWTFFLSLSHALQETDYELTALDGFLLGLVDTVRTELPPGSK
jgi:ATP-dependent protease ClpP protease subunit